MATGRNTSKTEIQKYGKKIDVTNFTSLKPQKHHKRGKKNKENINMKPKDEIPMMKSRSVESLSINVRFKRSRTSNPIHPIMPNNFMNQSLVNEAVHTNITLPIQSNYSQKQRQPTQSTVAVQQAGQAKMQTIVECKERKKKDYIKKNIKHINGLNEKVFGQKKGSLSDLEKTDFLNHT
jgi:hypothetical protein